MSLSNSEFMKTFKEVVASRGLKFTKQRGAIAEVVVSGAKHLTLDDILLKAREKHPSVGYATVYRTMKLMVMCGLVLENKFSDGPARYERADVEHHDHMICVKCGKIEEFEHPEIERLQHRLAESMGFTVVAHKHEVYVECADGECLTEQQ